MLKDIVNHLSECGDNELSRLIRESENDRTKSHARMRKVRRERNEPGSLFDSRRDY
jgi:hypothetical protein